MKRKQEPDKLITQAEAAKLRGVSLAAINDLIRRGRLQTVEMFGRKLLRRADVQAFRPDKSGPKRKTDLPPIVKKPDRKKRARKAELGAARRKARNRA